MPDVHIVGAGPAGTIAGITALRHGYDVTISEEHPEAGIPRNCSGLFSLDGLLSLKDFFDYRRIAINPINGADIYFAGEKFSIRRKTPVAQVCDRSLLDQMIAQKAQSQGAKIIYGERISSGNFRSSNVIGADGPLSFVARHFSFKAIKRFASTLQADLNYSAQDPHAVEVFLSNSLFPGFFGWVVPHNETTAEFGVGIELPADNFKAIDAWKNLLKLKGLDISSAAKPKGAVIPLEVRSKTALKRNQNSVLLVGDAAGQTKATTGGGVIFGGNCAKIAGANISNPTGYEWGWRSKYLFDLKVHKTIHDYLTKLPDDKMRSLGKRLKKMDFEKFLSSHGHMDRPSRMFCPSAALHLIRNLGALV